MKKEGLDHNENVEGTGLTEHILRLDLMVENTLAVDDFAKKFGT